MREDCSCRRWPSPSLAAPAGANAATSVDLTGDTLTVTGDAFANRIEVRRVSDGYLVRDPLATLAIETSSRCRFTSTASVHDAKRTLASEADVRIEGRAGDDALTVVGGTRGAILDGENGADTLTGGPGPETLRGGPGGDDFHGGGGIDTVTYSERINAAVNITLPVDALGRPCR